jgi:hypothetical protein
MNLLRIDDPFCLRDCLTHQELFASYSYNGRPDKPAIYLASKALVSLVNDAKWDMARIQPYVFNFVDIDAVLFEGLIGMANLPCYDRTVSDLLAGVIRFTDLSLDFWDFQVSPTLVVYIDMILNSAPMHTEERAPDDNDKMVIIEPVDDKYHVLVARMGAMIMCNLEDPRGEKRNSLLLLILDHNTNLNRSCTVVGERGANLVRG